MKTIMGLKTNGNSCMQGLANKTTDGDCGLLANTMNDFFVSVSDHLPRLNKNHKVFDVNEELPDQYLISVYTTFKALESVKANKATGPDNIPAWVLRNYANVLAPPLTAIFNNSLRKGVLPMEWKMANVIPLPKTSPPVSIEKDIRPISLTPIAAKVFESIIMKWVDETIEGEIDAKQFGGISGTSTTDVLVEPATTTEVEKIIMSSPNKSCDLDPLPTILLKACLDVLIKPITDIINASLCSGLFPEDFKCAHVNPILKKTTLSKEDLNSYRPISNLSFISKILEKVVANRLTSHININGLTNASQSAYKQFHSTETALLKVHNDINLNIDNGKVTALTLLDLSAAFDTIDHDILITRLSTWYGISGTALSWFTSYLTDRRQAIKIGNCFSDMLPTSCGVPRGSVLGPLLFTLYTTPLSSVIQSHNLDHHLYADDTQIYVSLTTPNTCRSLNQLRDCLQYVSLWMKNSKLKLNADKTEFLIIGTSTQRAKLNGFFPTHILSQSITPATSFLNLGVTFDENFNFKQHISKTCRCCFYHIRDLRRIRRFLSLSVAKTIATALVSSRLDYCNSLLYNTANKDIAKLQRVQNCLARVVTRSPRFSRSVPLLKSLHWLPVHYRIIFKICTITYQALSSTQPAYLNSMLTPARNSRQLRSTSSNPLYIPRVKTKAETRAFSVAAPTVWNSLPASVKSQGNIVSFRRHLKTYLFNAAYPP